jgi:hypothetical protein
MTPTDKSILTDRLHRLSTLTTAYSDALQAFREHAIACYRIRSEMLTAMLDHGQIPGELTRRYWRARRLTGEAHEAVGKAKAAMDAMEDGLMWDLEES